MPRPRQNELLERLRSEYGALGERIKQEEGREKARNAADDHRRWQLVGQVVVQKMQAAPGSDFFNTIMGYLDSSIRSASDRKLFGLTAKTTSGSDDGAQG